MRNKLEKLFGSLFITYVCSAPLLGLFTFFTQTDRNLTLTGNFLLLFLSVFCLFVEIFIWYIVLED